MRTDGLRDRGHGRRALGALVGLVALSVPASGVLRLPPRTGGDVVQRTPSGLAVHSTLLDATGDAPHTLGPVVAPAALSAPVVGAASTASGLGWWEAASDGGIFSFGDAKFLGSAGGLALHRPIVGMAATPDGGGYWLVASDGGIFSFGDARFAGSAGAMALPAPIVGMAPAPHGTGYWLLAANGAVFSFGSATSEGTPMVVSGGASSLVPTASGAGYWITDRAGNAAAFGDAEAVGSGAGTLASPVAAAVRANGGPALRLVGADGSSAALAAGGPVTVSASPLASTAPTGNSTSYTFMSTNSDGSPIRWDSCSPIHYVTNLAEAPPGAAAVVAGAVAQLSAATGVSFVNDGATTEIPTSTRQSYQPDRYGQRWAPVVIAWARPSETNVLPGGNVIGEGGSFWVQASGAPKIYVTGEVVIDSQNTGSLAASFGSGSTLGELLLHELGHVTGLGHTNDKAQIMYPVLLPIASASYGAGDLAGLARLGTAAGCLSTPMP